MPARISRKNSQQTVIPSEPRLCSSLVHFLNHLGGLFGQSHWAKPVVPCLTGHLRRAQVPDETLVERGCGRRDSVARAPSAQQGDRAIEAWFHVGSCFVLYGIYAIDPPNHLNECRQIYKHTWTFMSGSLGWFRPSPPLFFRDRQDTPKEGPGIFGRFYWFWHVLVQSCPK